MSYYPSELNFDDLLKQSPHDMSATAFGSFGSDSSVGSMGAMTSMNYMPAEDDKIRSLGDLKRVLIDQATELVWERSATMTDEEIRSSLDAYCQLARSRFYPQNKIDNICLSRSEVERSVRAYLLSHSAATEGTSVSGCNSNDTMELSG